MIEYKDQKYWNKELLKASSNNDLDGVKIAILHGADVNCKDCHNNMTPLLYAASYQYHNLFDMLLQHPDIDVNVTDIKSWAPLTIAISFNDFQLFNSLINHPKTNAIMQHPTLGCISLKDYCGTKHPELVFEMLTRFTRNSFY